MFAKTFRNTLIASSLLIGASLLAGPAAQAQDVVGNVLGISTVDYTAPGAVTLDPTAGNIGMDFGSVVVQDNSNDGWLLEVASANGGMLTDAAVNASIPYSALTFTSEDAMGNAANIVINAPEEDVEVYTFATLMCAAEPGCTAEITADIANTDIDGKPVGTYRDTLTFTLTSN